MLITISGDITSKTLKSITKSISNLDTKEALHIYFTTEGGYVAVAEAIIDVINAHKNIIKVTFYGEVLSAGMYIFLKLECEKTILPETIGMFHYAWQEVTITEGGKPSGVYDIFAMKEMKKAKGRTLEYLKDTKLNDKEINKIKAGKDVYFSYERMLELL